MRYAKNIKFVYWLIGFGCGVILSGILMVTIVLNSKEYKDELAYYFSGSKQEEAVGQPESLAVNPIENSLPTYEQADYTSDETDKLSEIGIESKENVDDKLGLEGQLNMEEQLEPLANESEKREMVSVYIPRTATANKICQLLEKEGIISNAGEFANYIIRNKKTKHLKDGTIILPLGATYEELLELLVIK